MTRERKLTELHAPCGNCVFLKKGAIELRPGRRRGIIRDLRDDRVMFFCHKTLGGDTSEDDGGKGGNYIPGERDKECAGAMIFRLKDGRMSQMMRISERLGLLDCAKLMEHADKVIDP